MSFVSRRRALGLVVVLAGCSSKSEAPTPLAEQAYPLPPVVEQGEVIAKIGPVTLTTGELEKRIQQQTPFARGQLQDPKRMEAYVTNEVRLEVLAQEAWRRKLHNDPETIREIKRLLTQRLIQEELDRLSKEIQVSDGDVLAEYEARKSEFVKPPQVRLAQIVLYVDTEAERKRANRRLGQIRAQVLAQERKSNYRAFANAAKEHSEDEATKNGSGDLQFLTRPELSERYGEEVATHMFDEVKVGDLVVANAPNAVVLFKKTGMRRGVNRTFEQMKPQLRGQVIQKRRTEAFNDFVEQLKKHRGVEFFPDRIDSIQLQPTGATSPPAPGQ